MNPIILLSPLAGWAAPLEEVPDPVFAGRMMGDGIAIDPMSDAIFAPCAGVIVKVHEARHAVTLRTDNGADLLIHLGVDTVALKGEGLIVHVGDGQRVAAGERLVSFDLDLLAQRAPSLMTPLLVTNAEAFRLRVLAVGREIAVGEPILELEPLASPVSPSPANDGAAVVRRARLTHPHGLHARPAALIAAEAKRAVAEVEVRLGPARANARSPVALMALGVAAGDEVEIRAAGPGAESVVAAILEAVARINAAPAEPAPVRSAAPAANGDGAIRGVRAAPGLAIGPIWRRITAEAPVVAVSAGEGQEAAALETALARTSADLAERRSRLAGEPRAVVEAHLALLEDPELLAAAQRGIASGASAGVAWRDAVQAYVGVLKRTGDPRLAERATDLKDLEQQVLWALAGRRPEPPVPPTGAILIADDLAPSDLVALDGAGLAGFATAGGGPTSHVAVLAAAMDLPALVAAGPALLAIPDGGAAILDADRGSLAPSPSPAQLAAAEAELAARRAAHADALTVAAEPGRTADGVRIEILGNVGQVADAALAARNGAEGCGLLRSEFLFLERTAPPGEDEQARAYAQVADSLSGRPVVIRTLDVGGDKPAPYLDLPAEENPALGLRGVRVSLREPEVLATQLRAILRAGGDQTRIMVPMVASAHELATVRARLTEIAAALGCAVPPLGVMIETPAAAISVDIMASFADFVSIGTNDLAQYTLAMDRSNPAIAAEVDALHPAVLRLMRLACDAAAAGGLPVSVCGGLASDPAAIPILIGLGVRSLSVSPVRIPDVKALIRRLDVAACRELAGRACAAASAADVRGLELKAPAKPRRSEAKGAAR